VIINLDIEHEPDLCVWLVTELARRRDTLAAQGEDFVSYTFDDAVTSLLWDAYERAHGHLDITGGSEARVPYTVHPDMADAHQVDRGP
jgi:hypothetical protein